MPVPITEQEKLSPAYKYFEEIEMTVPAPELFEAVEDLIPAELILHPFDMNRMFEEGYLPAKIGYARHNDGTAAIYNFAKFPGITPEMFDWWFVFKGLEPLHYKIWDQDNHYSTGTNSLEKSLDKSIPIRERIWDTVHFNKESLFPGGPILDLALNFRNPADIGFDAEKLKASGGTIVCSGGEEQTIMTSHFVRPAPGGSELHTHFWWGWHVKDGKPVKAIPDGAVVPLDIPKKILMHNIVEMSHLVVILPRIYEDLRDMLI